MLHVDVKTLHNETMIVENIRVIEIVVASTVYDKKSNCMIIA